MSEIQEPVELPGHCDGESAFEHPAFGQISASRFTATPGVVLYGSDFRHGNAITITIRRSQLHRDLSRDWHFSRDELIAVTLSEAQWATFVSSLNAGDGIPCTLEHVMGKRMPDLPVRVSTDVVKAELADKMQEVGERVDRAIAAMEGEIGKSLSGKKRDELLAELHQLRRDVSDRLPFMATSFEKHMEKTVEKAKIEVNAYVESHVRRAGLQALTDGNAPLQLGSGK